MTLPRMAAMAEVLWSPKELRDWSDFSKRIEPMLDRYRILGYNYSKSAYAVSCTAIPDPTDRSIAVSLSTEAIGTEIRYTLDESSPSPTSALYQNPFRISSTTRILAASFTEHGRIGMPLDQEIFCHKALMKPVIVKYPFERYTAGGPTGLTNGVRGSLSYMDGNWQGYRPYDFEGIIDLKEVHTISRISSSYLQDTRSWIFFPKAVEYAISTDGLDYTPLSTEDIPATTTPGEPSIKSIDRKFTPAKARYVRVRAKNFGVCPEWHIAKGESTWLFIDEIVVE
jgi:hexosaminidase